MDVLGIDLATEASKTAACWLRFALTGPAWNS
jgi:hypothetical protein